MNDAFWKGRRVFVTGCNGFLGSWLTQALVQRGAQVTGLIHEALPDSHLARSGVQRQIETVPGSVEQSGLLQDAFGSREIECVFHLAAQSQVGQANLDPLPTFESNVRGSWMLLEAARLSPGVRRVVLASSDKAYGSHPDLPYEEHYPLRGAHPYDVSKSCADLIALAYYQSYALPVTVTRCSNLYGGGDLNWERIVPGTIRSVLDGQSPIIRSDGSPSRDYLFIDDAVEGYLKLAQAMDDAAIHGEAFNFGTAQAVSVLEITRSLLKVMGREDLQPQILDQARGEIDDQTLSPEKAGLRLGWSPTTALDDGLRTTIDWYREFLNG
jgi:CDP-glucose 4,6-dehydratase